MILRFAPESMWGSANLQVNIAKIKVTTKKIFLHVCILQFLLFFVKDFPKLMRAGDVSSDYDGM